MRETENVVLAIPTRVTVRDQVYEMLRASILAGKLLPGQPLVEAHISAQLNTSKTPLREAFLRLEAERLVMLSPHKGAAVSSLSLQELRNCQDVRLVLEVAAFERAAGQITVDELDRARSWLERMREGARRGDWETYRQAHRPFHRTLFEAARNEVLTKTLLDLFDRMQRYSRFCLERNTDYWLRDEEGHHATFTALERRDVVAFRDLFGRMNDEFLNYVEQALQRHDSNLSRYFADRGPVDHDSAANRPILSEH